VPHGSLLTSPERGTTLFEIAPFAHSGNSVRETDILMTAREPLRAMVRDLRLARLGQPVAHHSELRPGRFGRDRIEDVRRRRAAT
jgi:hypothetical protein